MRFPPVGNRIIIIGASNAGKTTLAAHLSEQMNAPFIDLDALHWEPNWVEADDEVFRERIRTATAQDAWVLAGNYIAQQQHISWPRADTVVWLDLPLRTVLGRCVRRTWTRWRTRELLYGGNREDIWEQLRIWDTDNALLGHIVKTHRSRRRANEAAMRDSRWSHITFFRLRTPEEVERWLRSTSDQLRKADAAVSG